MQTEDLVLNYRCEGQVVEQICEVLPDVRVAIFAEALIVETIDLSDLSRLVIASENCDAVLKAHFQANEKCHSLDRVISTIDVISHEQVVCVWGASTDLEKLHEIVELAVDITTDSHWALDWLHVCLLLENFFGLKDDRKID